MPVVTRAFLGALVAAPFVALVACSATIRDDGFESDGDGGTGASTGRAEDDTGNGSIIGNGDSGAPAPVAGPGEIDLTAVTPCDADLDVDGDVDDFLKAVGLCKKAESDEEWGILEAGFKDEFGGGTNGNAAQHGILDRFGDIIEPREGENLGILSTGWAREYNDRNGSSQFFGEGNEWTRVGSSASSRNDMIVLAVKIRVPTNAKSISFDFNFHTSEWPNYVGSQFNDEFSVHLDGENITFDANNNPVNVNNNFFDRCTPNTQLANGERSVCAGGPDELDGTGFEPLFGSTTAGGATGWLTTKAPVEPGSTITLEFAIWDAKDQDLDSLVLIDNFKWDADPATTGTDRPVN